MFIKNISKSTVITNKLIIASSPKKRLTGLLAFKKPTSLLLKTRFGIHTFGMKHSIDVIILSRDGNVKKLICDLKPNSLFFWNIKYSTVLELPCGSIRKSDTNVGDKIKIQNI